MRNLISGATTSLVHGIREILPIALMFGAIWWIVTVLYAWTVYAVSLLGTFDSLLLVVTALLLTAMTVGWFRRKVKFVGVLSKKFSQYITKLPVIGGLAQTAYRMVDFAVKDPDADTKTTSVLFQETPGIFRLCVVIREEETPQGKILLLSSQCAGSLAAMLCVAMADDPRVIPINKLKADALMAGCITFGQGFSQDQMNAIAEAALSHGWT